MLTTYHIFATGLALVAVLLAVGAAHGIEDLAAEAHLAAPLTLDEARSGDDRERDREESRDEHLE